MHVSTLRLSDVFKCCQLWISDPLIPSVSATFMPADVARIMTVSFLGSMASELLGSSHLFCAIFSLGLSYWCTCLVFLLDLVSSVPC